MKFLNKRYLTAREAAALSEMLPKTLYELWFRGDLGDVKWRRTQSGRIEFHRDSFLQWMKRRLQRIKKAKKPGLSKKPSGVRRNRLHGRRKTREHHGSAG